MKLVENWKLVVRKSWSIWLILAAGVLSGLEASLESLPPFLSPDPGTFAAVSVVVSAMAWCARLLAQNALHPEPEEPAAEEQKEAQE